MNSLRTTDSRPYFERVFQEGVKRQIITQKTISRIISSGPNGVIQISEAFGNAFKRSGLQKGQDQFVALISFYLLYTYGENLIAGIQEIEKKDILELSRRGSMLIKNMAKYPESALLEIDEPPSKEYEAFFMGFERYQSKETYDQELEIRKNNLKLRAFCIKLHEESGFEWDGILSAGETILTELFPKVITGKCIQSEWEIAIGNGKFQHDRWNDLLGKIPAGHEKFKIEYSFENCFKEYNTYFLGISGVENELNFKKKINSKDWNTAFEGKRIGKTRIARGILSAIFLNSIKEKLTDAEIQEIIWKARKDYVTIDELVESFHDSIENSSIQGTLALEGIESIWGKYVLNDVIPLSIAVNRLKKALKIPEEKLK